jgi:GTPase SAR1 family protein
MNIGLIRTLVITVATIVVSSAPVWYWWNKDKLIIKRGLAILGMQGSGKTTIYDFLKNGKKAGDTTNVDDYEEFNYKIDTKTSIIIRKGKDIGGRDEFIKPFYKKMINDTNVDVCLFVFNAKEYLSNEEYRGGVNARLHFLFENGILKKKTKVIGSFLDHFTIGEQSKVKSKIIDHIKDKSYAELLSSQNFYLSDLTNRKQLKNIIETTLTESHV